MSQQSALRHLVADAADAAALPAEVRALFAERSRTWLVGASGIPFLPLGELMSLVNAAYEAGRNGRTTPRVVSYLDNPNATRPNG